MKRHLLQSPAWDQYEQLEGYQTFWRDGDGYKYLAVLHHTPLGNYLFCPYGPLLFNKKTTNTNSSISNSLGNTKDLLKSLNYALDSLRSLAREHNAFFARIEPVAELSSTDLANLGLIKSHDLEPAHTWVLDLTQPTEQILNGIEKTKVRHHRNHQKKGISVRTTQDPEQITILTTLLQGVGQRDNFTPQDETHLKNQLKSGFATLYVAELAGQPIAASLVYDYDDVRYYAHAATDDEHRKLMAGTILLIQMILDAKDQGAKTFDFWGITTSEDPSHPWYGFTQYKKSFGGHQVNYSGTWDFPIKKFRYSLYQLLRRLNRAKRKIHHS